MKKIPFILLCSITFLMNACAIHSSSKSENQSAGENTPKSIIGCWTVREFDDIILTDDNVSYPVINFREEGRMDATAGCNTISGEYTYAAATLTFSDKLCQTLMYCADEEINRNEHLLIQAMDSVLFVNSCGADSLLLQGKHTMFLVKATTTCP